MKAQAASIEATAALILVLSIAGISANYLNSYDNIVYMQRDFAIENIVAYDFIEQAYNNASLGNCLANLSSHNSTCIYSFLSLYKSTYRLSGISFYASNRYSIGNLNTGISRCFPFKVNNTIEEFCLYINA
jgi:hypothetical protein